MVDETTDTQTSTQTEPETQTNVAPGVAETSAVEPAAQADDATALGGGVEAKADEAAPTEETAATGAPETYELTAPEGFTISDEAKALAEPAFRDLGLSNEQANSLMPVAAKFAEQIKTGIEQDMLKAVTAQRKAWLDEAKADESIGGANWGESMVKAGKALDAAGYPAGSPFRNFLNETGLGNHPDMIKWAVSVGRLVSEDGFERGDAGAKVNIPTEKLLYPND